jgi:hypothetical protein
LSSEAESECEEKKGRISPPRNLKDPKITLTLPCC